MRPRVLVLDEPTAALDPASSTLVFETLREANRALEITIVVVEQKVALLSEYCNRVLVLNHGEIALQGEPHEVFARTDELRTIGVDCPRVTRIFNSLETDGLVSGHALSGCRRGRTPNHGNRRPRPCDKRHPGARRLPARAIAAPACERRRAGAHL